MRVIFTFYASHILPQQFYFKELQGLIYSLIKNTNLKKLHLSNNYKFFCFSNIFKHRNKKNIYSFIVSSPKEDFLFLLAEEILKKRRVKLNNLNLEIKSVKFFKVSFGGSKNKIITQTPVIVKIGKTHLKKYHIKANYPLYWKPKYPPEIFISQLEANIFKKYKCFYQKEIKEFPIFQKLSFKKSVSLPLKIHGKEITFIGSLWEFYFDFLDEKIKNILEFAIDCGLGEKNSMGFGFVKVKN